MRLKDLGILIVLGAIWGASYLFIRVAAPVLGPFALVEVRTAVAGLVLLAFALAAGHRPDLRRRWKEYLLLGAVNSAIPFTLISAAELHLTAALAAIINATTPLFTALVAAAWLGERLTVRKVAGVALGLLGVGVLVGWSPVPLTAATLWSAAASLGGALAYAAGGVYVSRAFQGTPALTLAVAQQLAAAVLLFVPAAASWPAAWPAAGVAGAVAALTLLSTAFAYVLYFYLIRTVGPTRTLSVTFLVPVFGLLWGALFLGEPAGLGTVGGLAIILASIVLVAELRLAPGPPAASRRTEAGAARSKHLKI